ncbi:hemerythrin domain-containing protein [Ottowia sp. VDI28]|uniref:hemerythrin domain-containing protein n=1 Tax=Ottowia sp. VDI28 TaxID=3133968 RepID=UPI003C2F6C4D
MTHSSVSLPVDTTLAPRMDIYAYIHKGLRTMMTETLHAVGRADVNDRAELHAACDRVLALADACASHLSHENTFIHPAMEACQPGSSSKIAHEHEEHQSAIAQLRETVAAVKSANPGTAQERAVRTLYLHLSLFVAENFMHMHIEETKHNQVLQAGYSDAELMALEGSIVASIPPEKNLMFLRWMVPAIAPAERAQLLGGMQAAAPAPAFAAALDTVRPHLSAREWGKLESTLKLAAVV